MKNRIEWRRGSFQRERNNHEQLSELLGTWDFVLGSSEFPHTIGFQYVLKEVRGSVILGHGRAAHRKFNVKLSPQTVGGRQYLFCMDVRESDVKEAYIYFFNRIENYISGRFSIWSTQGLLFDPEVDTLITSGIFVGCRHWLSWTG